MHSLQNEDLKYVHGGATNTCLLMMSKFASAGALAPIAALGLAAIFYPSVGMPIVNGIVGFVTYPAKLAWNVGESAYSGIKGYFSPGKKLIDNQVLE